MIIVILLFVLFLCFVVCLYYISSLLFVFVRCALYFIGHSALDSPRVYRTELNFHY
jgi:hypothetical protein